MAFGPHEVEWGCGVGKVVRNVEAKWLRRIALASVFGVFLDLVFRRRVGASPVRLCVSN